MKLIDSQKEIQEVIKMWNYSEEHRHRQIQKGIRQNLMGTELPVVICYGI